MSHSTLWLIALAPAAAIALYAGYRVVRDWLNQPPWLE